MKVEQANMGERFSNFINQLDGLDWQIGIITTDVSKDATNCDGRLVALEGLSGQYIFALDHGQEPGSADILEYCANGLRWIWKRIWDKGLDARNSTRILYH